MLTHDLVACPRCKAPAGARCTTSTGRPTSPHAARGAAAQASRHKLRETQILARQTNGESYPVGLTRCTAPSCTASIANHAWGHIKAAGWFFQKDGQQFCPDHVPDWVESWRASKATKATQR